MRSPLRALALVALGLLSAGWSPIRLDGADSPHLHWTQGYRVPIHIHSAGYSGVDFDALRDALEGSLATWTAIGGSSLVFIRDPAGRDGDTPAVDGVNTIRFEEARLPPEIDPDRVLAWTSPVSVTCTGVLLEADITFNAVTVRWSTADDSRLSDIETVSLHEVGHLLGLDHSGRRSAVMYPSVQERVRRGLDADDIAGLRALYGPAVGQPCAREADCGDGEACRFTLQSDETLQAFCGPALGRSTAGGRCDSAAGPCDNGCASGLCFGDDQCSAVCEQDRDCPAGWMCFAQEIEAGRAERFCTDLQACAPGGCPAGEACTLILDAEDTLLTICGPSGRGPDGSACDASEDCAGGLCWGGICSRLCDDDGQCSGDALCRTDGLSVGGRTQEFDLCDLGARCARDTDCLAGERCAYAAVGGRRQPRCVPDRGDEIGAACGAHDDCAGRICLDGQCSGVCSNDADCPADHACQRTPVDDQTLFLCVPQPAGAGGMGGMGGAGGMGGMGVGGMGGGGMGGMGGAGGGADPDAQVGPPADSGPPIVVVPEVREVETDDGGCHQAPGGSTGAALGLLLVLGLRRSRKKIR